MRESFIGFVIIMLVRLLDIISNKNYIIYIYTHTHTQMMLPPEPFVNQQVSKGVNMLDPLTKI